MAPSQNYLQRDLFELGLAVQSLIFWTDRLWFLADIDDPIPQRLTELLPEVRSRLGNLAKSTEDDTVRSLALEARSGLSSAWRAFLRRWQGSAHRSLINDISNSDDGCAPRSARRIRTPLVSKEWRQFCKSFANLKNAFSGVLTLWVRFGLLFAQTINNSEREQPAFLGERFPFQHLQDVLRKIRDNYPMLSDVDVQLFDSHDSDTGFFPADEIYPKLKAIRKIILDRLSRCDGADTDIKSAAATVLHKNNGADAHFGKQVSATIDTSVKPECASSRVTLYGQAERPVVNGKSKDHLTRAQYKVVRALIQAGQDSLTKDQLDNKSGCGDARKTMKRLAKSDQDWASVLVFAERSGVGYRIR